MIRSFFASIYHTQPLFRVCVLGFVISLCGLSILVDRLDRQLELGLGDPSDKGDSNVPRSAPDAWAMGYTAEKLSLWYEAIGEDARLEYYQHASWDMYPFAPAYNVVAVGLSLYAAEHWKITRARRLGRGAGLSAAEPKSIVPPMVYCIPIFTFVFDVVETSTLRHGAAIFPERLSKNAVFVASSCTRMKFACLFAWVIWIYIITFRPLPTKRGLRAPT
mmetsp:Transcript_18910/g.52562  ORF Transcript_18910/g.52562 Transcript_18910/m.52562 type:complete len:219 (-) Transcript_18910:945-1601(-)